MSFSRDISCINYEFREGGWGRQGTKEAWNGSRVLYRKWNVEEEIFLIRSSAREISFSEETRFGEWNMKIRAMKRRRLNRVH